VRLKGRLERFLVEAAGRVPFGAWLRLSAACDRVEGWLR
jgi:hypothetical protein